MRQTPVSTVSPRNSTPALLELPARRGYIGDAQRDPGGRGLEGLAVRLG